MHLNDEQLTEPTEQERAHLNSCHHCQQKLKVLSQVRESLNAISIPQAPFSVEQSWQSFQAMQSDDSINIASAKDEVGVLSRAKSFWQYSSFSLAASLLLVMFLYLDSSRLASIENNQLQVLIEHNHQLQSQLAETHNNRNDYGQLTYQLVTQDQKIQQAYLDNLSFKEKHALWLERQQIIEQWVAQPSIAQRFSI